MEPDDNYKHKALKTSLVLVTLHLLSAGLAHAVTVNLTDNNTQLTFNSDESDFSLPGWVSNPIQFHRILEWTVDGRKISVHPSVPTNWMDVDHAHAGAHVEQNQMHAQGPIFGSLTGPLVGGVVYTISGGTAGSSTSRLTEKVDIRNRSGETVSLATYGIAGMGWLPNPGGPHGDPVIPDYSGLNVSGATIAFIQGTTGAPSLVESPFAPVRVLPAVSFSGFNTFRATGIELAPGATLTIITELNVSRIRLPGERLPLPDQGEVLLSPFAQPNRDEMKEGNDLEQPADAERAALSPTPGPVPTDTPAPVLPPRNMEEAQAVVNGATPSPSPTTPAGSM